MSANRDALAAVATQLADAYKNKSAELDKAQKALADANATITDLSAEDASLPEITQVMTDALNPPAV